jgi:hypothetical protein
MVVDLADPRGLGCYTEEKERGMIVSQSSRVAELPAACKSTCSLVKKKRGSRRKKNV